MPVLFTASTGGHLSELYELASRFDLDTDDALWVTADTPQSRSLLADRRVKFVPPVRPRDGIALMKSIGGARRTIASGRWDAVISTGAAIAVAYLPIARAHGIPVHYVESAARTNTPSMTGRLLQKSPGTNLYTQYAAAADDRWLHRGSVFDNFVQAERRGSREIRSVLVTLGTSSFQFNRLIAQLERVLPPEMEVYWQLPFGGRLPRNGHAWRTIPKTDLDQLHKHVDVVIAHAGVGSALDALQHGHAPLLVPRESRFDENVDDHQHVIARELEGRGLAVAAGASTLQLAHLDRAAALRVRRSSNAPVFKLS